MTPLERATEALSTVVERPEPTRHEATAHLVLAAALSDEDEMVEHMRTAECTLTMPWVSLLACGHAVCYARHARAYLLGEFRCDVVAVSPDGNRRCSRTDPHPRDDDGAAHTFGVTP